MTRVRLETSQDSYSTVQVKIEVFKSIILICYKWHFVVKRFLNTYIYSQGPLVTMTAYFGLDLLCARFLGTYFLGKPLLWKMLAITSVWNFIHSQFIIVKCCTFDRDAIWYVSLIDNSCTFP